MKVNSINNIYNQSYKQNNVTKTNKQTAQNSVSFGGMGFFIKELRGFFTNNTNGIQKPTEVEIAPQEIDVEKSMEIIKLGDKQLAKANTHKTEAEIVLHQAYDTMETIQDYFYKGIRTDFEERKEAGDKITYKSINLGEVIEIEKIKPNGFKALEAKVNRSNGRVQSARIYYSTKDSEGYTQIKYDEIEFKNKKVKSIKTGILEDTPNTQTTQASYLYENDGIKQYQSDIETTRSEHKDKISENIKEEYQFNNGKLTSVKEDISTESGFAYEVTTTKSKSLFVDDMIHKYQEGITSARAYNVTSYNDISTFANATYTRNGNNSFIKA